MHFHHKYIGIAKVCLMEVGASLSATHHFSATRHSGSRNNTENYVGTVKYPIGVIGPLKAHEQMQPPVNTQCTDGTCYILLPFSSNDPEC